MQDRPDGLKVVPLTLHVLLFSYTVGVKGKIVLIWQRKMATTLMELASGRLNCMLYHCSEAAAPGSCLHGSTSTKNNPMFFVSDNKT
jgi:hypothetical protein